MSDRPKEPRSVGGNDFLNLGLSRLDRLCVIAAGILAGSPNARDEIVVALSRAILAKLEEE